MVSQQGVGAYRLPGDIIGVVTKMTVHPLQGPPRHLLGSAPPSTPPNIKGLTNSLVLCQLKH